MVQCLTGAKVLQSTAVDFSILCQCTERQPFVRAATFSVSLSFLPAQYQTALGFYKFRDLHHHNLTFPSSQKMARPYTGRAIPAVKSGDFPGSRSNNRLPGDNTSGQH